MVNFGVAVVQYHKNATMLRLCFLLLGLAMATAFFPTQFGARCSTQLSASHGMKNFRQLGHHIKVQLDTARDEANWEKSKEKWAASGKKEADEKKAAAKKVQKSD